MELFRQRDNRRTDGRNDRTFALVTIATKKVWNWARPQGKQYRCRVLKRAGECKDCQRKLIDLVRVRNS